MTKRWIAIAAAVLMLPIAACNTSDLESQNAPVALIITFVQLQKQIDVLGGAGCDQAVATINLEAFVKNPNTNPDVAVNPRLNDVRITRYRVSYIRTDGGTLVPASYVNAIDVLLTAGGTQGAFFNILRRDLFTQAPFAALIANGIDPETKRNRIRMDVVLEVFGETLGGEPVSSSTRIPLEFCANCGGCSL